MRLENFQKGIPYIILFFN